MWRKLTKCVVALCVAVSVFAGGVGVAQAVESCAEYICVTPFDLRLPEDDVE